MHRRTWPAPWLAAVAALVLTGVLAGPAHAEPAPQGVDRATGWYLALGDSLAAGYQPDRGDDPTGGYVGGVLDAVRAATPKTTLVNIACSGETAVTMVEGGRCAYEEGTQLAQALEFLGAHGRFTRVVTIDIGANDVQRCVSRDPVAIDLPCVQRGLADVQRILPAVLAQLRAAAPGARVVVANYYNPFLAAYLTGPAGQALAAQSAVLQATLNAVIGAAAAAAGAEVADVATAFRSTDTTPVTVPGLGTVPRNVATICAWTWMCTRNDIHANDTGYAVMATAVVARL
ncbi:SGNH/GDSL hydrolase family protein [Oryzobacter sp. R7]|uniref:SGNH/GDSL hydrolase family protein n=1 Tax=Oryzobacter faecalis TaxID=3388656 RepID=UPI00398D16D6